jgi:NAD(P)-dependent dehydrogenase (short-subunit alcohol dehydrogenase family)
MANRLNGKVAIVTGASFGIGRAIAETFAAEGAKVALCARREGPLLQTCDEIKAAGGQAVAIACDVANKDQVDNLIRQTVSHFGRLDILVNNAGVRGNIITAEDLTEDEWYRTFEIDAKGTWLCCKAAIPAMRKSGGGSIIMITSISSFIAQPKQGCYNAAKAAQELLGKCMALDVAKDKIRVNSICPAWVRTEMNAEQLAEMQAQPDKKFPPGISYNDVLALHPVGRVGEPQDIAWPAVYLASDESTWVTGASLMIDGGYTCQ